MLNYTRNIRDIDNNYYLLRLKDFICELNFLIFTHSAEITINDIFNLIQILTEVGVQWLNLEMLISVDGWLRKIECIINFLLSKLNEFEALINSNKKYYSIFITYLNFCLEYFILSIKSNNSCKSKVSIEEEIESGLKSILNVIRNFRFLPCDTSTTNLIENIIFLIKNIKNDDLSEAFENITNKSLLPQDKICEFYKFYIQILMDRKGFQKADHLLNNLFTFIGNNPKEEIECYLIKLEITLNSNSLDDNFDKIKDILEIITDSKDFNFDNLEEILKLSVVFNFYHILLDIMLIKLKGNVKTLKIFNNPLMTFNYENLKNFQLLNFIFLYNFFKSQYFKEMIDTSNKNNQIPNLLEIIKVMSECVLDNFANGLYEEEIIIILPSILKNVVILFSMVEKQNENFSSYFLLEIIKKLNNFQCQTEFVTLSLELYIRKKDFIKLRAIINDLEANKITNQSCLFYYSKIILELKEGSKWNILGKLTALFTQLNTQEDFNILYYLKLLNFIIENDYKDFSVINMILLNFTTKFSEIAKLIEQFEYSDNLNEKIYFFDAIHEITLFFTKQSQFTQQVNLLADFLQTLGDTIKNKRNDKTGIRFTSSFIKVLDVINLLISYDKNKINKTAENLPEYVIICICKLLNFLFVNVDLYIAEFFNNENLAEQVNSIVEQLQLYKNVTIFDISCQLTSNDESLFRSIHDNLINYMANFNETVSLVTNYLGEGELRAIFTEKVSNIQHSSSLVEKIFQIKLLTKLEKEENLLDHIFKLDEINVENKKLIFTINSILFQSGLKQACWKFLRYIINIITASIGKFIPRYYSLEDLFFVYRELINLSENNTGITVLKEFSNVVAQVASKIDELFLSENIEFILYQIQTNFELDNNSNEIILMKSIYEEIVKIPLRNKNFILSGLIEIINKKFN